jgi:hypothetical protein
MCAEWKNKELTSVRQIAPGRDVSYKSISKPASEGGITARRERGE